MTDVKIEIPGSGLTGRIGCRGLRITSIQRTRDRGGPPWKGLISTATYAHIDSDTGMVFTEDGDLVLCFISREKLPLPPLPPEPEPIPDPGPPPWGYVPKPQPRPIPDRPPRERITRVEK
jgi:hypothetical protein